MQIPEAFGSYFYRKLLSQQGILFYDIMYRQLMSGDYSGKSLFSSMNNDSCKDAFAAFKALRDDHPELFFLPYESRCIRAPEHLEFQYIPLYPDDMIRKIKRRLEAFLNKAVTPLIYQCHDMLERETIIYEKLATMLSYRNNNDHRDHSVVAPILFNEGVCEGLNALLMLCLRRCGIPCIKVTGKTINEHDTQHCWCIAWIEDIPVHLDITWEKTLGNRIRYDYFNLSDAQISIDHSDFRFRELPLCNYSVFDYYRYHSLCVRSRKELSYQMIKALCYNKSSILIRLTYNTDDPIKEIKTAMNESGITGNYSIHSHNPLGNILIIKK